MIDKIFHRLNIYGWEPVEDYLLAALLTGGNLLLVGEKGSGKNFAVSRIAKAMDIKFTIINACTAQISDLIGFYNPRSLSEGKLEYVNSPLTDRKFLMIDEVNRSHLNLQNQLSY
jgi:MoxR-like ATPase